MILNGTKPQIIEHVSPTEARAAHLRALEEATQEDRWMAAVWRVRNGRIEMVLRTTWNYLLDDLEPSVRLLSEHCAAEVERKKNEAIPDALPMADFVQKFPKITTEQKPAVAEGEEMKT